MYSCREDRKSGISRLRKDTGGIREKVEGKMALIKIKTAVEGANRLKRGNRQKHRKTSSKKKRSFK